MIASNEELNNSLNNTKRYTIDLPTHSVINLSEEQVIDVIKNSLPTLKKSNVITERESIIIQIM